MSAIFKPGDGDKLDRRSIDSVPSVIFSWSTNTRRHQRPSISTAQEDQNLEYFGLCLYSASLMLLTSGICLACAAVWAIMHQTPTVHLTDGTIYIGAYSFSLCSGLLCIPCGCIACAAHNDRKNYAFLPMLIVLLILSITMLGTGTSFTFVQRQRINFDSSLDRPFLLPGSFKTALNTSMLSTMSTFDNNSNHFKAWNLIQTKFRCCGTSSSRDWLLVRKATPKSCSESSQRGCIDLVAFALCWELSLIIGLSCIVFVVQLCCLLLSGMAYYKERVLRMCQ